MLENSGNHAFQAKHTTLVWHEQLNTASVSKLSKVNVLASGICVVKQSIKINNLLTKEITQDSKETTNNES